VKRILSTIAEYAGIAAVIGLYIAITAVESVTGAVAELKGKRS
jgi:hypothetical protein